ncbi:hypothetical protein [Neorhizobium alkalisoli]|uniref:Uncharacterized protein n=1 Tax=Neorhizobium alkalisoli TaxID=528178 RepID=A0A561QCJ4_9HYPH|nr:hypothetical protein [Neorhizobium alkalisoli]TWF48099.1 hypothetical protein FHW37_109162 [Neorhizobium alkalisoli]
MGSTFAPVRYRTIGRDAVILMGGGKGCRPVQVTQDALTDIQSPPRCDTDRLSQYLEVFAQIAEKKIEAGEFAFDGRIWITGNDVRAWRCNRLETDPIDQDAERRPGLSGKFQPTLG